MSTSHHPSHHQTSRVRLALRDLQGLRVLLGRLVLPALLAPLAHPAHPERLVLKDRLVRPDRRDPPVRMHRLRSPARAR